MMLRDRLFLRIQRFVPLLFTIFLFSCNGEHPGSNNSVDDYSGSVSCRECHEKFYNLWAPSHHGLAMQPITSNFINNKIILGQKEIFMEGASYQALQKDTSLFIQEIKSGIITDYNVLWALGGKNVYYFLTEWEGGRLQTLPLAYDVNTQLWYNNPASAVRHFPTQDQASVIDSAFSWRDRQYTFNTSCYACHVSQLKNNYNLATNTYQTNWKEAGINCETCHGPGKEHIKAALIAKKKGIALDSIKLIVTKNFTPLQHNSSCASCHAKMLPITSSYKPGDNFFDHFNLITLESIDFYPDGRDLGENYTMTSWQMNSCMQQSDLHCVTCHTSSGRYRFKNDDLVEANKACTNCHIKNGEFYEQHTHHALKNSSPKCIECHMPTTRFGNMSRSDHSFRPPMPAATIKFKSPNACNLCHSDKSAEWANQKVTQWKMNDYQKGTLYIGSLIDETRKGNWLRLDEMLEAIDSNKYGEVFTNSLIRILSTCENSKKWPILINALKNDSPLSRSSAALGLVGYRNEQAKAALFITAKDSIRLVRLAAAQALATYLPEEFSSEQATLFQKINYEYETSLVSRPDDWSAFYNLGNHYQNMGKTQEAISAYSTSLKIYPEAIMPLINSSFLYSITGNQAKAEANLKKALEVEPLSEAANLNYGLLMAELQRMNEAIQAFRTVLKVNSKNATAAYNLSVILSGSNLDESIKLSTQAMESSPDDPKFAYANAYFLNQNKNQTEAIIQLEKTIKKFPDHLSSILLLGNIYVESGNKTKAIDLYTKSMVNVGENQQIIYQLQSEIERIKAL